jgi:serine/threonine-protein kinase HipA
MDNYDQLLYAPSDVADNGWRLSPAYDLTYSDTYWGEQTTSVKGKGKNITEEDLVKVGTDAGIPKSRCEKCLKTVQEKIATLRTYWSV